MQMLRDRIRQGLQRLWASAFQDVEAEGGLTPIIEQWSASYTGHMLKMQGAATRRLLAGCGGFRPQGI